MCGIFFSIGFDNLPASVIDSVAHRGPDGRGWNEFSSPSGPVVLAHRRLAIVDLSEDGHQPMSSEDGRYWVTYNGEIYNYQEIRRELESLGHHFKTKTDTEVLLKSYLQWGANCLHHFNGMFAFVIWDDRDKKIFAARDRFGVKPLYYYRHGNKLAFASEIKQFTCIPGFVPKIERESVFYYLLSTYTCYSSLTFFEGVKNFAPSHYLEINNLQSSIKLVKWYDFETVKSRSSSSQMDLQELKNSFYNAVSLRLRSDVEVGACLSGGIDSSAIVSMVKEIHSGHSNIRFNTFSACYPGEAVDESRYIDFVTEKTQFNNYKIFPNPSELLSDLEEVVYHHDQPIGGATVYAQWCVFKKAKEMGVKVVLDGQGSDEIFGGYHSMVPSYYHELAASFRLLTLAKELGMAKNNWGYSSRTLLLRILEESYPSIFKRIAQFKGHSFVPKWINEKFVSKFPIDPYASAFKNLVETQEKFSIKSLIDSSHLKLKYTLPSLLHFEDRNSMAHGIEARTPFLDFTLVELALSLPSDSKIQDGVTKKILRESLNGILPQKIAERKDKLGFAVPETEWMSQPTIRKKITEQIMSSLDMMPEFLNVSEVKKMLEVENFQGQFFNLWPILDLGVFMKKFNLQGS